MPTCRQAPVKSFQQRTEGWTPLGIPWQGERSLLTAGMVVSALISLTFCARFMDRYHSLYEMTETGRVLIPGAQMESFASLMSGVLLGFLIMALAMIPLAAYHYGYHFQGSKSIYLMRRLPSKHELARRCLTVPVLGVLLAAAAAFLLVCIYYLMYIVITPEPALAPGQWQQFWSF